MPDTDRLILALVITALLALAAALAVRTYRAQHPRPPRPGVAELRARIEAERAQEHPSGYSLRRRLNDHESGRISPSPEVGDHGQEGEMRPGNVYQRSNRRIVTCDSDAYLMPSIGATAHRFRTLPAETLRGASGSSLTPRSTFGTFRAGACGARSRRPSMICVARTGSPAVLGTRSPSYPDAHPPAAGTVLSVLPGKGNPAMNPTTDQLCRIATRRDLWSYCRTPDNSIIERAQLTWGEDQYVVLRFGVLAASFSVTDWDIFERELAVW
jgi:hypothetical protein